MPMLHLLQIRTKLIQRYQITVITVLYLEEICFFSGHCWSCSCEISAFSHKTECKAALITIVSTVILMAEGLHYLIDPSPAEGTIGQLRRAVCAAAHMTTTARHFVPQLGDQEQ